MADSSFDIVSKVDRQEADNALNQAAKELSQRFDFKNTGTVIEWKGNSPPRSPRAPRSAPAPHLEVFRDKLVKRGVSLKALEAGEPRASGKEYKIALAFSSGLTTEQAKKMAKIIRDEGPKGIKTQVMGEELRVSAKSRDALQQAIALIKGADLTSRRSSSTTADPRRWHPQRTQPRQLEQAGIAGHKGVALQQRRGRQQPVEGSRCSQAMFPANRACRGSMGVPTARWRSPACPRNRRAPRRRRTCPA